MSFDLMVFDPEAAPADRKEFLVWFEAQAEWAENHSYDDPAVSAPSLQAWFHEMRQTFPAMNGPFSTADYDDPKISDYCIGQSVIYVCFAWSEVEAAHALMFELAKKHRVGFYYVSADDGQVWVPAPDGTYVLTHGTSAKPGTVRVIT